MGPLGFAPAKNGAGVDRCKVVSAFSQQDGGLDTVEANRQLGFKDDERTYECVDFILRDMGIKVSPPISSSAFLPSHLCGALYTLTCYGDLDDPLLRQELRERAPRNQSI